MAEDSKRSPLRKYGHPILQLRDKTWVDEIISCGDLSSYRGTPEGSEGGVWVKRFEDAFAGYMGTRYAVALNSATSALHIALIALGVSVGDEVITTPLTFSATAAAICTVGATPVFADVEEKTFNLDPAKALERINQKTKAIIPVHLMGHPACLNPFIVESLHWGYHIIEDAAQSLGAEYNRTKVGKIGDCGVFSFNQSKPISTGEGGMLVTDDEVVARKARALRNHAEVSSTLNHVGYNYRMCEIEAALGFSQLQDLEWKNEWRINLANRLTEGIKDIPGIYPPVVAPNCKHVYYTYGIVVDEKEYGIGRDELQKRLLAKGIYFGKGGYKPLHLFPFYQSLGYKKGIFPVAEKIFRTMMFTDILRYPMPIEEVDQIIEVIRNRG